MWPFNRRKSWLDADDEEWQLATWGWLLARLGEDRLKRAPLVTTTEAFFPLSAATGHARAQHIFACVRDLAGMTDWPCDLQPQAPRPGTHVSQLGMVQIDSGHSPAGTFSRQGNAALVTYDPASIGEPVKLVATLVHELAHYLLHAQPDLPPGQELMEEFATDLTTVYLGFGLFGANQAFNFSQFQNVRTHGWQTLSLGYLRERDWAFALAVYCALRGDDIATLKPLLKPYLYKDTQHAARYLRKYPDVLAKIAEHKAAYAGQAR